MSQKTYYQYVEQLKYPHDVRQAAREELARLEHARPEIGLTEHFIHKMAVLKETIEATEVVREQKTEYSYG
ncbi:MAG TPA: hypothetical protein V6C86_24200 [Oculatellaceae cyanobacterium]